MARSGSEPWTLGSWPMQNTTWKNTHYLGSSSTRRFSFYRLVNRAHTSPSYIRWPWYHKQDNCSAESYCNGGASSPPSCIPNCQRTPQLVQRKSSFANSCILHCVGSVLPSTAWLWQPSKPPQDPSSSAACMASPRLLYSVDRKQAGSVFVTMSIINRILIHITTSVHKNLSYTKLTLWLHWACWLTNRCFDWIISIVAYTR